MDACSICSILVRDKEASRSIQASSTSTRGGHMRRLRVPDDYGNNMHAKLSGDTSHVAGGPPPDRCV
jgi:hypothetical protein